MPNINQAILMGHAAKEPALHHTQNGRAVASLRMATNDGYKDNTGQWVDNPPEWHTVVIWGNKAEQAAAEISKGDLVFVKGKLTTRKWTDKQGVDHYTTEINAHVCVKCHYEKRSGTYPPPPGDGEYYGPEQQPAQQFDDYDIGDLGPPLDMDNLPVGGGA
jgi:single-strand DNA-binding protein